MYEYICYIDESGDEGFHERSSKYFGFGAVIIKKENDLLLPTFQKKVLNKISVNKKRPLKHIHLADLKHEQRKFICNSILNEKLPIRTFVVISNKKAISEQLTDFNKEKNKLFNYLAGHLLERISWFVRDDRTNVSQKAKIVFSNRRQLKIDNINKYLDDLKKDKTCSTEWSSFDGIDIKNHNQRVGLQIADVVATSFRRYAFEGGVLGVETSYAKILQPFIYQQNNTVENYGIKIRGIDLKSLDRETKEMLINNYGFKVSP